MTVLEWLRSLPSWMVLSLAMNGLLFLAVLFGLRGSQTTEAQSGSVLPQANASIAAAESPSAFMPQVGDRQYLNYQQWVSLLRQEAQAAKDAPRLTVLLGDSISLWFPPQFLPGRRTWINQAISGENSGTLLQRLDALDGAQVDTIFVMIGINDLIGGKTEDQVIRNVEKVVLYLEQKHPEANIVLQSILPHASENATWEGRDRLLLLPNERIRNVNDALASIAVKNKLYYLDLYPLFANGEGLIRPDLTTDGLHLNERGYLVWRTALAMLMTDELGG